MCGWMSKYKVYQILNDYNVWIPILLLIFYFFTRLFTTV